MSALERQDCALDAGALLAAGLRGDGEGIEALILASDDVDHWRGVAMVLGGMLTGTLRNHGDEGFVDWQRQRIIDGDVGRGYEGMS